MYVIAGKNNIAVSALNYLIFSMKLNKDKVAVVCNKTDDGNNSWQMSLRKRAKELEVSEINLEDAEKYASVFLSLEFDRIIKPKNFTTDKIFNIHFSLLPKYKGMYTSIWPVLHNDSVSGVTLHRIDSGIDTGEIIAQKRFSIFNRETSKDVYLKCIYYAIELFEEFIEVLLFGDVRSQSQGALHSTYFSKKTINFQNLTLDFNKTAWEIGRQIKAFSFRGYQLLSFQNCNVSNFEILKSISNKKPGSLIEETEVFFKISTIDFDIVLFKDMLNDLFKEFMANNIEDDIERSLKNLVNVDDRNEKSWSLLMVAAFNNNYNLTMKLIELGADINALNYKHTSVLMYAKDGALREKDNRIFLRLLDLGANINHKDLTQRSISDYASEQEMLFLTSRPAQNKNTLI